MESKTLIQYNKDDDTYLFKFHDSDYTKARKVFATFADNKELNFDWRDAAFCSRTIRLENENPEKSNFTGQTNGTIFYSEIELQNEMIYLRELIANEDNS